ncbi:MAG: hypothetical protein IT323_13410 [Anaerolineae bacterium]|nr:hypothetical protein [Anaerolineae bacterium]
MTDNEIIALARSQSIRHYKPRQRLSIRGRGRILLRLTLAVLFAVAVWLAVASLAQSATRPPLCHRTHYGVRIQTPQTRQSYYLHLGHGDWAAVNGACKRGGK